MDTTTTPPARKLALTEKYRPTTLADLYGQFEAVCCLRDYIDAPYPAAFMFEGATGTGKTSAAMALANELGVDLTWSFHKIDSGTADANSVEEAVKSMRYSVASGGFRMILVDEADTMTAKAKELFLSVLEEIPGRNVLVFTTNNPERMPTRFLDRCQRVRFSSDPAQLQQDAEALIATIWEAEGMPGTPPPVAGNGDIIVNGALSFRRVVQAVQSARYARPGSTPPPIQPPTVSPTPSKPATVKVKTDTNQPKPVDAGYQVKDGYRLVVKVKSLSETLELWVNATGWRFEKIVRSAWGTTLAVTHSEKVGAAWEVEIRQMEVSNV
jgi:hypothetical protein